MMLTAPFSAVGQRRSRVDPMNVPLSYTTDARNAAVVGTLQCNAVSQVQVTDARADKTLGERIHESKPLKAVVTTDSDTAAWAQIGVQTVLQQNGFSFAGGPKLTLSVDSLHTQETIWHRSGYDARISMTAHLQSSSGKTRWTETTQGAAATTATRAASRTTSRRSMRRSPTRL